jgi:hypothetical protein
MRIALNRYVPQILTQKKKIITNRQTTYNKVCIGEHLSDFLFRMVRNKENALSPFPFNML